MDFSGFGNNKTFKAGGDPADPYMYITASLDLSGAVDGGTYYFNLDNNYDYSKNADYGRFIIVDSKTVVSEVIVYSKDDLVSVDNLEDEPVLRIGGADKTDPVKPYVQVPWAAPAGTAPVLPPSFAWDDLSLEEVNVGAVNYFGHEGGHFPYNEDLDAKEDTSIQYKYLAVTVNPDTAINAQAQLSSEAKRKKKLMRAPRSLPTGTPVIQKGNVNVILKVYPERNK
jgi:hypothetical protein